MKNVALEEKIRGIALDTGADFCGVADLSPAREAILEQGGPAVSSFPRAVSVGIALFHAIVDQLPQRMSDRAVAMSYRHHGYEFVNQRLDHVAARVGSQLQREGHRAMPVPASQTVDNKRLCGIFSHKMAAHLAGLGWIGKSCLLVTPEAGPRVRWATVLTDAPLPAGQPMELRCGDCQDCVDVCPPGAFTGAPFREGEPRAVRYDAHKCRAYFTELAETMDPPVCGMCVYVCPHGKQS